MQDSNPRLGSGDSGLQIPDESAGRTLVRTLRDHRAFCSICLAPLEATPVLRFDPEGPKEPFRTGRTLEEYGKPTEDTPPDRADAEGNVVEASRSKRAICECGDVDGLPAGESRSRETYDDAVAHLTSLLEENGVSIDPTVLEDAVADQFSKGHTGQFVETLGLGVHKAAVES